MNYKKDGDPLISGDILNELLLKKIRKNGKSYSINYKLTDNVIGDNIYGLCLIITEEVSKNEIKIYLTLPAFNREKRIVYNKTSKGCGNLQQPVYVTSGPQVYSSEYKIKDRFVKNVIFPSMLPSDKEKGYSDTLVFYKYSDSDNWGYYREGRDSYMLGSSCNEIRFPQKIVVKDNNNKYVKLDYYLGNTLYKFLDMGIEGKLPTIQDVRYWSVYSSEETLVGIINSRLEAEIERFYRPGYIPGQVLNHAVESYLNASYLFEYTQKYRNPTNHKIILPSRYESSFMETDFNRFIDRSATSQDAKAGHVGKLYHGVYIDPIKRTLKTSDDFKPFSKRVLHNPFIAFIGSNRRPVIEYLNHQVLDIEGREEPLIKSKYYDKEISTTNLLTLRMNLNCHITGVSTHEDGAVISESTAKKLGAYKEHIDSITIDGNAIYECKVRPEKDNDTAKSLAKYIHSYNIYDDEREKYLIHPGKEILWFKQQDKEGTCLSNVKLKGIVNDITSVKYKDTTKSRINIYIKSIVYLKLECGDKIADLHGNKYTIQSILPDDKMPQLPDGQYADMVVGYRIGKRKTFATDIEERFSIAAKNTDKQILIDPYDTKKEIPVILNKDKKGIPKFNKGSLRYYGNTVKHVKYNENIIRGKNNGIAYGYRMIVRLNHNNIEKTKNSYSLNMTREGITKAGLDNQKLTDTVFPLYATGGNQSLKKFVSSIYNSAHYKELNNILTVLGISRSKEGKWHRVANITRSNVPDIAFEIKNKVDRNKYLATDFVETNVQNTVLDKRLKHTFGFIRVPNTLPLVDKFRTDKNYKSEKGQYILVPPQSEALHLTQGTIILRTIQVAANRLVAEFKSYEFVKSRFADQLERILDQEARCQKALDLYIEAVANPAIGKNGHVRSIVFPRIECSSSSVIQTDMRLKLDEIIISHRDLKEWMKNRSFRETYNIKEIDDFDSAYNTVKRGEMYVLYIREPAHQRRNSLCLRVKSVKNIRGAKVSPLILHLLDGDLDGDTEKHIPAFTKDMIKDFKQFLPSRLIENDPGIWKPGKEFEDVKPDYLSIVERASRTNGLSSNLFNLEKTEGSENIIDTIFTDFMKLENIVLEQMYTARDFWYIKNQVARAGALGSDIRIVSMKLSDDINKGEKYGSEFYHLLAQDALNAKHREHSVSEYIIHELRKDHDKINTKKVRSLLLELNCSADVLKNVYKIIKYLKANKISLSELVDTFPYYKATRSSASVESLYNLVQLQEKEPFFSEAFTFLSDKDVENDPIKYMVNSM